MAIVTLLLTGQSNAVGMNPASALPSYMASFNYGQTYIWNGGPYWGVIQPGVNTGGPGPSTQGNWGVETVIAYAFRQQHPNDTLLIIKSAKGETPLGQVTGVDWNPNSLGEMFDFTTDAIHNAKVAAASIGIDATPTYWAHLQGESDAMSVGLALTYADNFDALLTKAASAWFLGASVINTAVAEVRPGLLPYAHSVNAGINQHASKSIATGPLEVLPDGIHYDASGIIGLGTSIFNAIF